MPKPMPLKKYRTVIALLCALVVVSPVPRADDIKLPLLGDTTSGVISLQQERVLGQAWLKVFRSRVGTYSDPQMQGYLENLLFNLATHSELIDRRLDLLIVNNPTLNAFAVPGGVVGVHTGLFLYAESEAQLASVLSHELAHLSQRHFARNVANRKANSYTSMAGMLVGLVLAATVGGDAGLAAMSVSQAAAIDKNLRFSRQHEQEADRLGLETLYRADLDPSAMSTMFERMLAATRYTGRRPPEFLLTHPLTEKRVADARNRTTGYPQRHYPQRLEYHLMRARALIAIDGNAQRSVKRFQSMLDGHSLSPSAARYGLALALSSAGQHESAGKALKELLDEDQSSFSYQLAAVELARNAQRFTEALKRLEKLGADHPTSYPLQAELAETLVVAGRYAEAETVLEELSRQRPFDPDIWFELAETSGLAGDIPGVHRARAEYFILSGVFGKAREQLNYARKLLIQDFQKTAQIDQRLRELAQMEAQAKRL